MFQSTSPVLSLLPTLFFSSFIAAPLLSSFQPTRFPQARPLCLSLASQPSSFHLWILPLLIFISTSPLLPSFTFPPLLLILSLSSLSCPSRLQQSLSSHLILVFIFIFILIFVLVLSLLLFLFSIVSSLSPHLILSLLSLPPSHPFLSSSFSLNLFSFLLSLSHPLLLPHLHPLPCPFPFSLLPLLSLSSFFSPSRPLLSSPTFLVLYLILPLLSCSSPPLCFLLPSTPRVPAEEQSVSRLFLCA